MTLKRKHDPAYLIGLLVGIAYSLFIASKSVIGFVEPLATGNSNATFDLELILRFCWNILMCISFIAILKWKKWGAYLFFVTAIFWVGSVTLIHGKSLTYFLVASSVSIGPFLLILIPVWKQLD